MAKTKPKPARVFPGRRKLEALGINLPLLPVTSAGPFPKSADLVEVREKVNQKVLPVSELIRKGRISTDLWLRDQTRLEVDVHVDGEMDRGHPVEFYADKIEGFVPGGLVRMFENHYVRKPFIRGKLSWKGPILVETWQQNQRATNRPLKAIVMGPLTLLDWSFNEFYSSREEALTDLTALVRKEVQSLSDAGVKIIQIDEPALTGRPSEFDHAASCLKEIVKGLRPYFILRQAYSDLSPLWPKIERLPVDNFYVDGANSELSLLGAIKKNPTEKDVTLGVQDVLSPLKEPAAKWEGRIRAALKVISPQQLWLAPDSGLQFVGIEEAVKRLESLVATARKFRKSIKK